MVSFLRKRSDDLVPENTLEIQNKIDRIKDRKRTGSIASLFLVHRKSYIKGFVVGKHFHFPLDKTTIEEIIDSYEGSILIKEPEFIEGLDLFIPCYSSVEMINYMLKFLADKNYDKIGYQIFSFLFKIFEGDDHRVYQNFDNCLYFASKREALIYFFEYADFDEEKISIILELVDSRKIWGIIKENNHVSFLETGEVLVYPK